MTDNTAPVFALDATSTWDDLEIALDGCAAYQSAQRGKILPLAFFSPMTEPENMDAWEPMKTAPENLLIVSIERAVDATILKALLQAKATVGEIHVAFPDSHVQIDFGLPLADVYRQMADAGILAATMIRGDTDALSFFFLRARSAVQAFDRELRKVTS